MFSSDISVLQLSFNEFHDLKAGDQPEYGEYCLLELKDGRHTAGEWFPKSNTKKELEGYFGRGTADTVDATEVSKWHALRRYDLTNCLEAEVNHINLGPEKEDAYSLIIKGFKPMKAKSQPKKEQFCLLIMKDGTLAAGRWNPYSDGTGCFIYASALASHSQKKVWAWTALSPDDIFEREEKIERERQQEEELNKHPSADPEKFKYGTDIEVYYEKALEKLKKEYPWATLAQMKKEQPYVIVPLHGKYVFALDNGVFYNTRQIKEWTDGATADEFIDFLCEYTRETVRNSNPDRQFKYGMDIEVYIDKAYENVKKDYRWFKKSMINDSWSYSIKKVNGDWEFVRIYDGRDTVLKVSSADKFIEELEESFRSDALRANPVAAQYDVEFGHVDICGWNLERYTFFKLKTGDYKVSVTAGDRCAGGSREFFITPYCFEAKTYDEFLDRYSEIVPGYSFGLYKEDLLPDKKLANFLGYSK